MHVKYKGKDVVIKFVVKRICTTNKLIFYLATLSYMYNSNSTQCSPVYSSFCVHLRIFHCT